jgi:Cu(I)/Ag(I) efflux system membrane fusion protein
MTRMALAGPMLVGLSAALILGACADRGHADAAGGSTTERKILYYRDPMHPAYTSPAPGKAPDCGMDLEPVYADAAEAVSVSPRAQSLMGVKVAKATRESATGAIRTVGRVVPEENRVYPVRAGCDGSITKVHPETATGDRVRKGQPLVSVYGPELTVAQRSFLYALRASQNPPPTHAGEDPGQPVLTLNEARLFLTGLGVGQSQIERLEATRQPMLDVDLIAPASGVILDRSVSPGQRFEKGAELFRIADLSRVWIIADLLGDDQGSVRAGDRAQVTIPGATGDTLSARVSDALPRFDAASRALKLRLNADNPRLALRPDMIVDLTFPVGFPEAVTVPAEAVVDGGTGTIVYVVQGEQTFVRRPVKTGWRSGGRVQIVSGLNAGESIVVSGNALLDSESRMRREEAGAHD